MATVAPDAPVSQSESAVPSSTLGAAGPVTTTRSALPPTTKRTFKVIVLGDPNVGKTCLTFRFCNGRFPERTEATIGVDFRERLFTMDDELLRIQLWDTAGQERFRQSMTAHYYRNVHAVVLVYDVTKRETFSHLSHWIDECKSHSVTFDAVPALVVGNKCDCKEEVAVATHEAQRLADQHGLPLFETSAKADSMADHVESIFMTLVHKLRERKTMAPVGVSPATSTLKLTDEEAEGEDEGWCC